MIAVLTFATFSISLNGRVVAPQARALVVGGRVLVPVRTLGEALGARVRYDARRRTVFVRTDVVAAAFALRAPMQSVGGRVYAPLRAVSKPFGVVIRYDGKAHTIALTQPVRAALARSNAMSSAQPRAAASATAAAIVLSPPSGARVHEPYPSISARFAGANTIDAGSARVMLDGVDVTAQAAVIGDEVLLTPRRALTPGQHTVTVTGRSAGGEPLSAAWSFGDTFAFSSGPPPTPSPVRAIYLDRYVTPGTTAFDVIVQGAPGLTGYVGVDGVGELFPLTVATYDAYVAHVVVPYGVVQPNARVAARITLPDGTLQTIVLPQTIPLVTVTPSPAPKRAATPVPSPRPTRRSVNVSSPVPTAAASASPPSSTATPAPVPTHHHRVLAAPRASPKPAATPGG